MRSPKYRRTSKPLGIFMLVCFPALLVGCSGSEYQLADVEGYITLDGEAMEGVKIVFAPIGSSDSPYPGPRSQATTDETGRFVLATSDGHPGAVVGPHRVRMTTVRQRVDPDNPLRIVGVAPERVPRAYQSGGKLDTEVPSTGLAEFRFDLTSQP